jgi:hypothetical protein
MPQRKLRLQEVSFTNNFCSPTFGETIMLTRTSSILFVAMFALVLTTTVQVYALPTTMVFQDDPKHCDPLSIPKLVDEIGDPNAGFPDDEILAHRDLGKTDPVCLDFNLIDADFLVSITNLTKKHFKEVWYVADEGTTITNYDGFANHSSLTPTREAFRIDFAGIHHPLVFESFKADGIWASGEEWHFVLQDYFNASGYSPDAIESLGVGDLSLDGKFLKSSGSIIARVPEPATCMLMLIGLGAVIGRRRS